MTTVLIRCARDSRSELHTAGEEAARVACSRTVGAPILIQKDTLGKPFGQVVGADTPIALSISHSFPFAFAVASVRHVALGADIERIRDFALHTKDAFLTASEKKYIARAPEEKKFLETLCWSLKEAVLKARGTGLRIHPKKVDVTGLLTRRSRVSISDVPYRAHAHWWQPSKNFVATTVSLKD